jgi:uncharacterized protein YjbI with pentapeptide repeats
MATTGKKNPASNATNALTAPARGNVESPRRSEPAPPAASALVAKADDLEALRTAVIDGATVSFGLWISYLFVLFYFLIAAGGVTHADLFFERPVKLPFVYDVGLPLKGFFWLSPTIFLIVHIFVLLHLAMLASKVRAFDSELRARIDDPRVRTELRRQLPINMFVQFLAGPRELRDSIQGVLLWLIAFISMVIGPVALLVFFQLQFLAYHEEWVSWWQRGAVAADLVLLWTLWPRVGLPGGGFARAAGAGRRGFVDAMQRIATIAVMILITAVSVPLVFTFATFPGEWLDDSFRSRPEFDSIRKLVVDFDPLDSRYHGLWYDRILLEGLDVIDHTKLDTEAKIAALPETLSLRRRNLEGAVLSGARLPKVNLEGANLRGAFLLGADLRGALLDHAQLVGAQLGRARLQGALLDHAQLLGAELGFAEIQGASLECAQLQGASLGEARLQGAWLRTAQVQGAWLKDAHLEGAILDNAQLQGAELVGAHFEGASLRNAFAWRADARDAYGTTDARVERVETGPKRLECPPEYWRQPQVVAWSAAYLTSLISRIEREIRREVFALPPKLRLPLLNPDMSLPDEQQMTEHWEKVQSLSPAPDAYEAKLAEQWWQIGCSIDGAPYVVRGLLKRILTPAESPFSRESTEVPRLAARLLTDECVGGITFSDRGRAKLRELRAPAAQSLPNQNAERPRP